MDIAKYLKTIANLNDYIAFTRDVENQRNDINVPFNISTILSLKDTRSIEIEYFNKYEENGGATKIFELLLRSPPSKTWSLLGGELVNLLQYWLEAIRKHLLFHNIHWWTFLNLILNFIKGIHLKDVVLNMVLIEETAECLLDLATHRIPDPVQRNEIIQTFNMISAEASRKIRLKYKEKFQEYFVKLSALIASSGDFPLQYRMLETLLRWLLPRHDPTERRLAAAKWFPEETCSRRSVQIFLEKPWQNFMKDARDFLNALNEPRDLVTSVMCKTFSVRRRVCISEQYWLDVNSSTQSLSVMVDGKLAAGASQRDHACDVLLVCDDNTASVELKRESQEVFIIASVLDLSRVYPFSSDVIGDSKRCSDIRFALSTRSDISRLDKSLRGVFGNKYQTCMDVHAAMGTSQDDRFENVDVINGTEEDIRFSMPLETRRRKHSGYIVYPRNPGARNSPSTISTSSLAQLHEKLAALPHYTFDKEPVSVCALPQLSTVSEASEIEENHTNNSSLSTIKLRRYGVCQKRSIKTDGKTSHSTSNDSNEKRNLSPIVNDDGENSISCLLLATIGSADDSVISDTIGRLPRNIPCNTDNIVDLLAQEALQDNVDRYDSGINSGENKKISDPQQKTHSQVIEPICEYTKSIEFLEVPLPKEQQPINESSNEIVENTPFSCVPVTRYKHKSDKKSLKTNLVYSTETSDVKLIHDEDTVEKFFSKHFIENRNGELVISPTLARKINETSSECSDVPDHSIFVPEQSFKYIVQNIEKECLFIPDADIFECVNAMVDKVSQDLNKCARYIDLVNDLEEVHNPHVTGSLKTGTINKTVEGLATPSLKKNVNNSVPESKDKSNNVVKLKYTKRKSLSCKKTSKNTNKSNAAQPFPIMSPIIERESVIDDMVSKNVDSFVETPKSIGTPLRRKRKLYSPKDETCHENINIPKAEIKSDSTTNMKSRICSKTPNLIAVSYKELEQERKKQIRRPRNRLSLKKPELAVSPKTLKMNKIFDSLKDVIDGEPVKLANKTEANKDMTVYNYTTDSEDEVDKDKSNSAHNKVSSPGAINTRTVTTRKLSKRIDETGKTLQINNKKNKKGVKPTRKPRAKRSTMKQDKNNKPKVLEPPKLNLEDERMRDVVPEILNTSLVIECSTNQEKSPHKIPDPQLNVIPQMECIKEDDCKSEDQNIDKNQHKNKAKRTLSLKRCRDTPKVNLDKNIADNDGTISPLPGLVVETVLTTEFDINDSVSANMLQKFKDIYQGKPVIDSEPNTHNNTQNLLSDTYERINYSSSILNVTEELNRAGDNKHYESDNKLAKKKKVKKQNVTGVTKVEQSGITKSDAVEERNFAKLSVELNSERSMATVGNSHSPITAHGDFDENPPTSSLLNETVQPRIVEQEYLNQSLKDFFSKLTHQLNEPEQEENVGNDGYKEGIQEYDSSIKSCSSKSPVVVVARLSPEYMRSLVSVNSGTIDTNNTTPKLNFDSKAQTCKKDKENAYDLEKTDKTSRTTRSKTARKSTISPIKLLDNLELNKAKVPTLQHSESGDECLKRIKSIFSSKKHTTIQSSSTPIVKNSSYCSKTSEHSRVENITEESINSRPSSNSNVLKRKSSPILASSKRSKHDEVNNNLGSSITESGPSLSSVNEWFKRNEPSSAEDSINLSIKENIKNVLEKLDTTLVEIHHNTSKRFINMFVDAASQLSSLKQQREQLQRQTAIEILSGVVSLVDDKFMALNERLQSMDDQFMESLKQKAHDLIREECKQKRVMVTLLREDVQAVLEHVEDRTRHRKRNT